MMIHNLRISDNGIKKLKQLEGCVKIGDRHVVYDDKTGKIVNLNQPLPRGATIGYGHLITSGESFTNGISETTATELLCADIEVAENAVRNTITMQLTQNQYDALVIFAYNIGTKNFVTSTVVRYLNNPNFHSPLYPNLESAWKAWNKSGGQKNAGLVNRRDAEWNIFKNAKYFY